MRIVFDTNVIIAAFGTRGLCADILSVCLDRETIVLSEEILAECAEHLAGKFKLPKTRVGEIVAFLRQTAAIVVPASVPSDACRDVDDLPILGTALAGRAACLVTGDQDLLMLVEYEGVKIQSPREFYESLRNE